MNNKGVKTFPIPALTYIPTLEKCSIIGEEKLNCQVRNGAGCFLLSINTRKREIKTNKIHSIILSLR